MAEKTTTKKIVIETQYKSLEAFAKKLEEIKSSGSKFDINTKGVKHLEEMILSTERLMELFKKSSDESFALVDPSEMRMLTKLFSTYMSKAEGFSRALVSLQSSIPDSIKKQLEAADEAITKKQGEKKTKIRSKGGLTAGFNKKVQADFEQGTQNLKNEDGFPQFKNASSMMKKVIELESISEDKLTEQDKLIMSTWQSVKTLLSPYLENYIAAWNSAEKDIQECNDEIEKQIQLKQQLLNGASNSPEISSESVQTLQGYFGTLNDGQKALSNLEKQQTDYNKEQRKTTSETRDNTNSNKKLNDSLKENRTTLGKAIYNVVSYGSALTFVRSISSRLITTITEMDKALTDMTVVTQLSREQAWELTGQLQELATQTGMTATEIAQMTTMYLQQGKTLSDALTMTEVAAKAARIAGITGSESIKLLTNAMNGFQMSAEQALEVSDKFAALAASAATNYEGLATALSKTASQANLAGMSMDFTLGLLTKGIEVTQEAPETIGTALKTVIARMRELTDYGETLEDGVDVNRVDKALKNIGVNLLDSNREFRDLDVVLTEVGQKWDSLNKNQQANVAVALAGTRFNETMACTWAA